MTDLMNSIVDLLKDVAFWNSLNLVRADLYGADLSGAELREANLRRANLREANLRGADLRRAGLNEANLRWANLSSANLRRANLRRADLRRANLRWADLRGTNLSGADLSGADLRGTSLNEANLRWADLSGAYLNEADLSGADLSGADLSEAELSQTEGIFTAKCYLSQFDTDSAGVLVYRCERGYRNKPESWVIAPGAFIEEVPNPDRGTKCGSGVSFATKEWIENEFDSPIIWLCRILWEDLADVVVPFNTDGKARCARLQLVKRLKEEA